MSFLEPSSRSEVSISRVASEIVAIAHGDAPQLLAGFPGVSGRRINAYRLASLQLRAHEWHAHLRHAGNTAAVAQNAIATAFGETWATINQWRGAILRELGEARYSRAIQDAAQRRWVMAGIWRNSEQAETMLQRDGRAYRQELARSLKAVN